MLNVCVLLPSRVPHAKDRAGAEVPGLLPRDAACGQTNRSVWHINTDRIIKAAKHKQALWVINVKS